MAMMSTFARLLAGYRHRAELSQAELARRAGFDHSAVSGWESARRNPEYETVQTLADALRLSQADRDRLTLAAGFVPQDLPQGTTEYLLAVIGTARRVSERITTIPAREAAA